MTTISNNDDHQLLFQQGIDEFNRQEFFACHETLEKLWNKQKEPERKFTQGIIQVAVGYHHLLNDNWVGASKLFKRGLSYISPFLPAYNGINLVDFTKQVTLTLSQLENMPANRLVIPKIKSEVKE